MGLKAALSKPFAAIINGQLNKLRENAVELQQKTFEYLIIQGKKTAFGKTNNFEEITNYDYFKNNVPLYDY